MGKEIRAVEEQMDESWSVNLLGITPERMGFEMIK